MTAHASATGPRCASSHPIDTGFERYGEHLWLSADEQRAFVGAEDDVEVWPRTIERLACA